MREFYLRVAMIGSAFDDDRWAELARILRDTADRIEREEEDGRVLDENGNKCGHFVIEEDNPPKPWRFQVDDWVRLTADDVEAPISDAEGNILNDSDPLGIVPKGAEGNVIQIDQDDQNHFDAQIICDMRWVTDTGEKRTAIIYLSGDDCLELAES